MIRSAVPCAADAMPLLRPWAGTAPRAAGILLLLAAGLALSGCSNRPMAAGFGPLPQRSLQSVGHWQVVANDVASAVSAYLVKETGKKDPVQVYMMRDDDTVFADAFQSALSTRMVQLGHPVAMDPRPDVTAVGIDVMLVRRQPGDTRTVPGPLTALAGGAAVVNWMWDRFPWGVTATAVGLGLDAARSLPDSTDTEMLMTVTLAKDGFFTYRSSAVYYLDGRDLWQYQAAGDFRWARSLNDLPDGTIGYDLGRKPYIRPTAR